ncbi:MAG: hypothetical protein HQ483_14665 [Rhodospirillales bacterium]|nr:hypothetical protein [Rhodospirillales bacterium]
MWKRLFTEHPASVDETYFEHVGVALGFSLRLFYGALVCLVHAFLPFLFVKTGSNVITGLHARMSVNRQRRVEKSGTADPNGEAAIRA